MRRGLLLGATLSVVNAGLAIALGWSLRGPREFGWFSYSPMPQRYADYLPQQHVLGGWAAAGLVTGVLIAANMLLVAGYVIIRGRRTAPE